MKKRRFLCFLLAAFLISGCGGSSEPSEKQFEAATDAAADIAQTTASVEEQTLEAGVAPAQELETQPSVAAFTYGRAATEQVDQRGIHFFTFHRTTQTYTNEEGESLLEETLTKPVFYAADPEVSSWVTGLVDEMYLLDVSYGRDLLEYAEADFKESGKESFYTYSHHVSRGVGRHDDRIISLLSLSSVYSGGANPYSVQTAYNLDLKNLRVLNLEDVISESGYEALNTLVCASVEDRFSSMGEGALFEDYDETIARDLTYGNMMPYWYFNAEGLVIFFNQYTLGPYAAGIIRIQLNYEDLDGILLPEFLPESYSGIAAGLSIDTEPADGEWVYSVIFSEGETAYISIEGQAHCIQLSEVFWAEQTPVGENMLFSANHIDDTTTFAVTGDLLNNDQIYALEYSDQRGGPNVVYIKHRKIMLDFPTG